MACLEFVGADGHTAALQAKSGGAVLDNVKHGRICGWYRHRLLNAF